MVLITLQYECEVRVAESGTRKRSIVALSLSTISKLFTAYVVVYLLPKVIGTLSHLCTYSGGLKGTD